jgi:hypothetical protein
VYNGYYINYCLPYFKIRHSSVIEKYLFRSITIAAGFFTAPIADGLFSLRANQTLRSSVGVLPSGSAKLCSAYTINARLLRSSNAQLYLRSSFVPRKGHNFSLLITPPVTSPWLSSNQPRWCDQSTQSWAIFKRTLPQSSRSNVTCAVQVDVNCSCCTPDYGNVKYPKHIQWSSNKIKILVLHLVGPFVCIYIQQYVSCWVHGSLSLVVVGRQRQAHNS